MQLFIKIENDGEVEPQAFNLMGATTKRGDDSKIGFFGSGNKYSIALLMRKNIFFKVYSGNKEIVFKKKPMKFRGKRIEMITINGKDTSLTTDMGADWEDWFIIREFYCNAVDEGNAEISVETELKPTKNKTTIFIEKTPELSDMFSNMGNYMITTDVGLVGEVDTSYNGKVRAFTKIGDNDGLLCFRKGIRAVEANNRKKSLYRYDFSKVDINESRVIKSESEIKTRIAAFFALTENEVVIRNYIDNWGSVSEGDINWNYLWSEKLSKTWKKILLKETIYPASVAMLAGDTDMKQSSVILPDELAKKIAEEIKEVNVVGMNKGNTYLIRDTLPAETKKINKSKKELKKYGYEVVKEIKMASFTKSNVGACYDPSAELILLSSRIVDLSQDDLTRTLLEEHFHTLGHSDASRGFEDFLMKEIIKAKKG